MHSPSFTSSLWTSQSELCSPGSDRKSRLLGHGRLLSIRVSLSDGPSSIGSRKSQHSPRSALVHPKTRFTANRRTAARFGCTMLVCVCANLSFPFCAAWSEDPFKTTEQDTLSLHFSMVFIKQKEPLTTPSLLRTSPKWCSKAYGQSTVGLSLAVFQVCQSRKQTVSLPSQAFELGEP